MEILLIIISDKEKTVMFPTSSQSRHWMFKNEEAIQKIKLQTNSAFVSRSIEILLSMKRFLIIV